MKRAMKLEIVSKEIQDPEMGVNDKSDSQRKVDSVENTSSSTDMLTTDDNQASKIHAEEIASTSKVEVVVKHKDSEKLKAEVLVLQNTDSESEDCLVTSTCKSSSPECQELNSASEYLYNIILDSQSEAAAKAEDSDVCMDDASDIQESDRASASTSQLNSNESLLSKENLSAAKEPKSISNIEDSKSHRQKAHYVSDSSDYDSDGSSTCESSDCEEYFENMRKRGEPLAKLPVLKTKGELLPEDLPPVEDLHITVDSSELLIVGYVLHLIIAKERNEFLVIVNSSENSNALNEDSVLFLSSDKPLGKIHEVFGGINKPSYSVRFNNADDIFNKGVTVGQIVYYSPRNDDLTHYVLVDVLKMQKGSDASWKDNNEPPADQIDYSDDEQEKLAKQKARAKNRGREPNLNDGEVVDVTPNKMDRRQVTHNQSRPYKRASRNSFQSTSPGPSRSFPHSYSNQSFGPTPPSDNFGSPGLPRNAISPQPFGMTPSNFAPFQSSLQRSMPSPQQFGSFPHRNAASPQPFASFPHSNAASPQPFGSFPHSNAPSPQPFPQNSVSSYQPFTGPPTSYVLASPNLPSSHITGAPQLNPSSLMAAPQNNIPLQQQILLQSQRPISTFLSQPPPNHNSHQNSTNFVHQSFTSPAFGALPAARPTMQNTSNQSPVNQMFFSSGTNARHTGLSGNLNISQPTHIMHMNSNGHQGQSYGMVQSNTANSFVCPQFPPRNTQHNNTHRPVTEPIFVSIQSGVLPERPTRSFAPCQTPPPVLANQQGLSMMSGVHPPILPSHTPPLRNQPSLSLLHPPVFQSQIPPSTVHFRTNSLEDPMSAQNYRLF